MGGNIFVPSLRGFINSLIAGFKEASRGWRIRNKFTLLSYELIRLIPNFIERRSTSISTIRRRLMKILIKRVIINYRDCKFQLVDEECLAILSDKFESWAWNYLKIPEDGVFIDIGAHVGRYAIPIAKFLNNGIVVAVEAAPENYSTLVKNVKLNGLNNVLVFNLAAWREEKNLTLHFSEYSGRHTVKGSSNCNSAHKVLAKPIDSVVAECGIKRVDMVKIDVEGAEAEVLEGMRKTIEKFKPNLLIEVFQENADRVFSFLKEINYEFEEIPNSQTCNMFYLFCHARRDAY